MSDKSKSVLNSLTFAIMLSVGPICWALPAINNVIVLVAACALLCYLIAGNTIVQSRVLPLALYCLLFFVGTFLTYSANPVLVQYFLEFLMMGVVGLYISQIDIDKNLTITLTCYLSIILIPTVSHIDFLGTDSQGLWMGFSYGSLRFIIALLFALLFIHYKWKLHKVLFALSVIVYIAFYFLYASRGAILAVVVFVCLSYYICKLGDKTHKRILWGVAMISFACFFEPLMEWMQSMLSNLGLDVYAIDKFLRMYEEGGIDNGRADIIQRGLGMAFHSPIWGNGIAAYENAFHTNWVHNVFVQLFVEGGILLLLPFLYFIFLSLKYIFQSHHNKEDRLFLAMLMAGGLTELLFSSYLWRSQVFWLYIGYTIKLKKQSY